MRSNPQILFRPVSTAVLSGFEGEARERVYVSVQIELAALLGC